MTVDIQFAVLIHFEKLKISERHMTKHFTSICLSDNFDQ